MNGDTPPAVKNHPLVKGVTLAIDGTDPEEMRDILEGEVASKRAATQHSAQFFADASWNEAVCGPVADR